MKKITFLCLIFFSFCFWSCQNDLEIDENFSELSSSVSKSKIVTIAQAKEAAVKFLNQNGKQAKGLPNFTEGNITEVQTIENDNGIPIMYALNLGENSGFVVMSASLVERPILAYSHEGKLCYYWRLQRCCRLGLYQIFKNRRFNAIR